MKRTIFVIALIVGGCASTDDLLQQPPDFAITTSEKSDDVKDCIIGRNPGAYTVTSFKGGWIVSMAGTVGGANGVIAISVVPTGNHTRVESHVSKYLIVRGFYDDDIKPCLSRLRPAAP